MSFITFPLASGFTGGGATVTLKTYSTTQGTITGAIDGVNTVFNTATALNLLDGFVVVNGVMQIYSVDYSVVGTTITFVVAPANIIGEHIIAHGAEV